MRKRGFILLMIILSGGCAESRYTQTGNGTYELVLVDDGFMNLANSSRLDKEWEGKAKELCPQGYTVKNQTYTPERSFDHAMLSGTVICR